MSADDHIELVRRLFDAHNQGAETTLGAYDSFFHPELEWVPVIVGGPEGASYRGQDGLGRWYAERDESFVDSTVEVESCREVAPDVILVLGRSIARGRSSGVEIDEEVGLLMWFEDGLIRRDHAYGSHRSAEEAAQRLSSEQDA